MLKIEEDEDSFWNRYCASEVNRVTKNIHKPADQIKIDFWKYFVEENAVSVFVIHALNIAILVMLIVILGTASYIRDPNSLGLITFTQSDFACIGSIVDVVVWVIMSSMVCLQVVISLAGSRQLLGDSKSWEAIGNLVLMTRFFMLVIRIMKFSTDSNVTCNYVEGLRYDRKFDDVQALVYRLVLDNGQLFVFSTTPFPSPWILLFCIIETTNQIFRTVSCRGELEKILGGRLIRILCLSQILYSFGVWFASSTLTVVAQSIHRSLREQVDMFNRKRLFVDWLSTELKVTLQKIVNSKGMLDDLCHAFESIDNLESASTPCTGAVVTPLDMNKIGMCTEHVNLLVDNLLLLVRLEEGRLDLNSWQEIRLNNLINSLLTGYRMRGLRDVLVLDMDRCVILSEATCVKLLLRNFIYIAGAALNLISLAGSCPELRLEVGVTQDMDVQTAYGQVHRDVERRSSHARVGATLRFCLGWDTEACHVSLDSSTIPSTVLFACEALCKTFGGTFQLRNDGFKATWRCRVNKAKPRFLSHQEGAVHPEEQQRLFDVTKSTADAIWRRLLSHRMRILVVATESQVASVVDPFIRAVKYFRDADVTYVTSWKTVDPSFYAAEFSDFEFILTTDTITCAYVRGVNFPNRLVLISGGAQYLDQHVKHQCDYIVPIPCLDDDVDTFVLSLAADQSSLAQRNIFTTIPKSSYAGRTGTIEGDVERFQTFGSRFDFKEGTILGIKAFKTMELEETFTKWRLCNPLPLRMYWRHHSTLTDLGVLLSWYALGENFIAKNFIPSLYIPEQMAFGLFTSGLFFVVFLMGRTVLYERVLKRLKITMRSYMLFLGFCYCGSFLLVTFMVFYAPLHHFDYVMPELTRKETIGQLKAENFGSYEWYTVILTVVRNHALLPVEHAFFVPWPYGMIRALLSAVRLQILLVFVLRRGLHASQFAVAQVLFFIVTLVNMFMHQNVEWYHRTAFQLLRKNHFNNDYIDHCTVLCKQDLMKPLEDIVAAKQKFLDDLLGALLLCEEARSRKVYSKFREISSFQEGFLLLKSFLDQLDLAPNLAVQLSREDDRCDRLILSTVEPILMRSELIGFVNALTTSSSTDVQVFMRVDAELAYVKVDRKIFNMIITNALSMCMKNIARLLETNSRSKDLQQSILILVRYDAGATSYSMSEVNMLQVELYDTGEISPDDQISFSQLVCKDVIFRATPKNREAACNVGRVLREQYSCGQVLTIPFQMHPASRQAAALHSKRHPHQEQISNQRRVRPERQPIDSKLPRFHKARVSAVRHEKKIVFVYPSDGQHQYDLAVTNIFELQGWNCERVFGVDELLVIPDLEHMDCVMFVEDSRKYAREADRTRSRAKGGDGLGQGRADGGDGLGQGRANGGDGLGQGRAKGGDGLGQGRANGGNGLGQGRAKGGDSLGQHRKLDQIPDRTFNSVQPAVEIQDLHRIRFSGFKMVVACLHYVSQGSPAMASAAHRTKLLDLHLEKPLTSQKLDEVQRICSKRAAEIFLGL